VVSLLAGAGDFAHLQKNWDCPKHLFSWHWDCFLVVKQLGSEADRLHPSCAEVKNLWGYSSTLPCFHGVCGDNLASLCPFASCNKNGKCIH
jgi:hypothetical protein